MSVLLLPTEDFSKAVYARLSSQLTGVEVTDAPEKDIVPPFVVIGETIANFLHTFGTSSFWQLDTKLHCYTGPDDRYQTVQIGRAPNYALQALVYAALTDDSLGPIVMNGDSANWQVSTMLHPLDSRTFIDADNKSMHGVLSFRSFVISYT